MFKISNYLDMTNPVFQDKTEGELAKMITKEFYNQLWIEYIIDNALDRVENIVDKLVNSRTET